MSYPRSLAVRVLTRVLSEHQPLDEALAAVSGEVPPSTYGWLQEVCAGTLRWKGRLDLILDSVAFKKKPSGWLRKVLLIAVYQLVVQERIQAALVVSETVDEVKSKEGKQPAQFANACLRKIAEHSSDWRTQPFAPEAPVKEQAQWASLPLWLWTQLVKDHGIEWATSYAQASLERPTTWVRSQSKDWNPSWAQAGQIPSSWQVTEGGNLTLKSGFSDGQFIVQDISSQFLIHEISQKVRAGDQKLKMLDLCAAPGGKSVGMAWNGFEVIAMDHSLPRTALLRQTVERTQASVTVQDWDHLKNISNMDLVWLDAPCSGTGILRRHPDVRWLRQEKELQALSQTQSDLVKQAWKKVTPGGFLVYSVCSILKEEGSGLFEKVKLPGSEIVAVWALSPQESPYGDGFWACLFKKSV